MSFKKILCALSGDDCAIIRRCGAKTKNLFAGMGLCAAAIFALCAAGSYCAFINPFPYRLIAIPVALFFALMIFNIYLLLLYTLSKNVLPHKKDRKTRIAALVMRALFICLIAAVVSKPLEAELFFGVLEAEIKGYKKQKLAEYSRATEEFYSGETAQIEKMIESRRRLLQEAETDELIGKYQNMLAEKEEEKAGSLAAMRRLIENSNFYVYGIAQLNRKYPLCWLFTILCLMVFLAPAVLKNSIPERSDFYRFKRKIETHLVRDEHRKFKQRYRSIASEKFAADLDFSEPYRDAPFNTLLKSDNTQYLSEKRFLDELYDA